MVMKVHNLNESAKIKFTAEPGVREMLERYIAARNARIAPAKLTITGVVNEAIREYVENRGSAAPEQQEGRATA